MSIITVDFETTYSSEYTLSKLSTEAYIRDPRFEVIGVSIAVGNAQPVWYTGSDIRPAIDSIPWSQHSLLAFNTVFDGAILGWHYGHYPALYLDAMGMARCCGAAARGASLKAVCETLEVGEKGDYVVKAMGKRAKDFTPQELYDYGQYCINDVEKTRLIYKKLKPKFPDTEVLVQDRMLRMFIEPVLRFDSQVLREYHKEVVDKKRAAMEQVALAMGVDNTEESIKPILMSNPKFAELLRSFGVEPPLKLSPTTGKETFAFAKTDPELLELLEDDNEIVANIVAARLGVKSTIEETRAEKFIEIAERGVWPCQYTYCGAHLRFSGGGKVNPQNLKRGGVLRNAVLPPVGHKLIVVDLGQIECRMLNYVAEQEDVVATFRNYDADLGPHVYCVFASKIYGRDITKKDEPQYTVGKHGELSLGYMASAKAFKRMLFAKAQLTLPQPELENVVRIYRDSHRKVENMWYRGDEVLDAIINGHTFSFGRFGVLDGTHPEDGVGLPGGLFVRLPGLVKAMGPDGQRKFVYMHKNKPTEIYGANLVALCIQGLARIVMTDAWLRIGKRIPARLTVHDELVFAVPDADVSWAKEFIYEEMTRQLPWAPDFPLACDIGVGENYGAAKT